MNRQDKYTQSTALHRFLPLVSLLVLLCLRAPAQQFLFQPYEQDQGLKNRDVFQLIQDTSGLLWIATENGLFRYDGSEFHRFGPSDGIEESLVIGLHQDSSGRIWAATSDRLYFFTGTRFQPVVTSKPIQLAPGQRIASVDPQHILFIDRGILMLAQPRSSGSWAASPYFTSAQTAGHPELSQLHSIFVDGDRSIWLGCAQQLCHVQNQRASQRIDQLDQRIDQRIDTLGEAQGIPSASWLALLRDNHGTLWARSAQHVAVLIPGAALFAPRDITPSSVGSFSGSGILTLGHDRDGRILTQTSTGIARWDQDYWQLFDRSNGIDFSDISSILTDRHGSLWFGTRGHGLRRWLGYDEVENWTAAQGLRNNIVWSIFRDRQSRLWLGDDLQVSQLDERNNRIFAPPDLTATPFPHAIGIAQSSDNAIWLFGIDGHLLRSNGTVQRSAAEPELPAIARILYDSSHRIWIMSRQGLYVIQNPAANTPPEKIDNPAIAADSFADAAEGPDGALWFISDHHLYRFAHNRWAEIPLDSALIEGQMRGIAAAPDGTLWIGGGLPGLLHLRVSGNRAQLLNLFAAPQIVSTDVQFVRFDRRGLLWIGTDLGVSVFDGRSWRLLTQRDGLISNDIDEGAFFADNDGSVWIGANGGTIHLLHPGRLFSTEPLNISIRSASLGDLPLNLDGQSNSWRWRNTPLDVAFTSLDYERQGSIHFLYRLVGLEPGWLQTFQHRLHYPAMPAGDYRFEVQAIDPDQHRQSAIASFELSIRPPWWHTRLFYLALALLALTLSILLWRWRERRLIHRQQMLERLVAQRTSELEAEKIELMAAREALHHQATHDALTGVWNRSAILTILEQQIDRARTQGSPLAVVLADIDFFKKVNDSLGHLAGDVILRDAAQRMALSIRPSDFIGRYGGEEFLIVMPGLHPRDSALRFRQLQDAISQDPFCYLTESIPVTSSFGVASLNDDTDAVEDLIGRADEALYAAKASGRNCVVVYSEPTQPDPLFDRP